MSVEFKPYGHVVPLGLGVIRRGEPLLKWHPYDPSKAAEVQREQRALHAKIPGTTPNEVYFDEAHQVDGLALALIPYKGPSSELAQCLHDIDAAAKEISNATAVLSRDPVPEIPVTADMIVVGTHTLIGFNLDPSFEPVSWAHIVRDVYLSMHDVAPNSETARAFRDQELIAALTAERDEARAERDQLRQAIKNNAAEFDADMDATRTDLMAARDALTKFIAANVAPPEPTAPILNAIRAREMDRRRVGP